MTELGRLHVSLLELLVRYEPGIAPDGTSPCPYVVAGGGWMAGRRSWTARAAVQHRPQLRPVLSSVVGTLVRHGLAEQTDRTPEAMQQLVTDLGMQVTPGVRRIERSWSPTELGERVLGYYLEAGADFAAAEETGALPA